MRTRNLCSLGILAFFVTSLEAGTFILTGVDASRGANITFYNVSKGAFEQGFAGEILGTFDGISVSPLFCVDLFTDIGYGSYTSTPLNPRLVRHEDRVAWLYLNQLATVNSADTGLAFQLAIWDIVHDNGDGLSAGLVQSSASSVVGLTQNQVDLANGYINTSLGHSVTTGVSIYQNFDPTSGAPAQNLVGADAPEPSTLVFAAIGFLILGLVRVMPGDRKYAKPR